MYKVFSPCNSIRSLICFVKTFDIILPNIITVQNNSFYLDLVRKVRKTLRISDKIVALICKMILLSSPLPSQIFNNNYFGKLRVIVKDGKVWFCLADACKALEIANPRNVKKRLDSRGVHTMDVSTNSKNRHGEFTHTQTFTFIDESNLFR